MIQWLIFVPYSICLIFLGMALVKIGLLPEDWISLWCFVSFLVSLFLAQSTKEFIIAKIKHRLRARKKKDWESIKAMLLVVGPPSSRFSIKISALVNNDSAIKNASCKVDKEELETPLQVYSTRTRPDVVGMDIAENSYLLKNKYKAGKSYSVKINLEYKDGKTSTIKTKVVAQT